MARYIEGFPTTPTLSLYLDGFTRRGAGSILFFDAQTGADPVAAAGTRGLFVDNTDRLSYWNGTSAIRLTGAGGVATTWEGLYAVDGTFALTTGTWTITQSSNNAIITFNKTAVGAGAVIAITNSGTGNDITGNASNWSVTAAGAATVASMISNGAITCTAISDVTAGATLQVNGNGAGGVDIGSTSTGAITLGRATTVTTGGLTVTAGGVTVSAGQYAHTDTSNTAAGILFTNNTITTFGIGGVSTGAVLLRSTSLTTGSLVSLQLTEGTLAGGFYLRCFDATATGNVLTLGEDGAIVITGADSTTMFTVTAGDVVVTLGSITVTNDDDNALTVDITNNTTTTGGMARFAGSGVFTGTGASSFFLISPSGLTTGTAFAITAAALTTGNGAVITVNAMTTGIGLQLTSTGTIITTGAMLDIVADTATTAGAGGAGRGLVRISADALTTGVVFDVSSTTTAGTSFQLADFDHTASGALSAKTGQLVNVTCSRTSTATITDNFDAFSVIRTNVSNDAAVTLTSQGSAVYVEVISTQTLGTLTDTSNGIELVMTGGGVADGIGLSLTHTGTTAGRAVDMTLSHTTLADIIRVTANAVTTGTLMGIDINGLTTGIGFRITHTTSVITTGSVMRLTSTGVDTGAGQGTLFDLVSSGATAATVCSLVTAALTTGTMFIMTGNAVTTGRVLDINCTGITTGRAISIDMGAGIYTGTGALQITGSGTTTGSVVLISNSGVMTGAGKLLELVAAGATTATAVVDYTANAITTGIAFRITANGLTTGSGISIVSSTAGQTAGSMSYLVCNDGGVDVFSVGTNGHLESRQTTAPTVVVTTANGITGSALTAGSTDTVGNITTTGTSTGSSVLTITFNVAYAVAPRVLIVPRNTAAAAPNTGNLMYVSASTTTTFTITFPASGTFAAAPSVDYFICEMGS